MLVQIILFQEWVGLLTCDLDYEAEFHQVKELWQENWDLYYST